MSDVEFINQTKKWINHKLILANGSSFYNQPKTKAAVFYVKQKFANLLYYQQKNAIQLALTIKKHESLLETILPIPNNPSYQNSLIILQKLIQTAEHILKTNNIIL